MQIQTYNAAEDFLCAATPFLLKHEAAHNLLLGLVGELVHTRICTVQEDPFLTLVTSQGQPIWCSTTNSTIYAFIGSVCGCRARASLAEAGRACIPALPRPEWREWAAREQRRLREHVAHTHWESRTAHNGPARLSSPRYSHTNVSLGNCVRRPRLTELC